MSTKYPSIPEHKLTPQGRIYMRSVSTDEKLQDIAPDFRGNGATPQDKADHTKAWISKENVTGEEKEKEKQSSTARAQHDKYAQELNKRLGPVSFVMDSLHNGIEAAKESVSGEGKAAAAASETEGESQNSVAGRISQYTQAAWDKVNELKPTLAGAKEPDAKESHVEEIKQRMTEVAEKGLRDKNVTERAKEETSSGSTNLLAVGGNDVLKALSGGASTQEDPSRANMRVATEALS